MQNSPGKIRLISEGYAAWVEPMSFNRISIILLTTLTFDEAKQICSNLRNAFCRFFSLHYSVFNIHTVSRVGNRKGRNVSDFREMCKLFLLKKPREFQSIRHEQTCYH